MSLPKALLLGAVEHPLAQLIEACTAIGLSLDQLEAVDMSLDRALAPLERKPGFHGLVVTLKPLRKALQFSHSLLFDQLEPGVQLLTLPLAKHRGEVLDELIRFRNLPVSLTETDQISFLPVEALVLSKGDPMSHLQSGRRTLFLPFIGMDQKFRLGFDRLKTARLAFERPPGGNKATYSGSSPSISSGFYLTIQKLSIATPFIPSSDEVFFMWLKV